MAMTETDGPSPTIVHILGVGHSGTTLLDLLIGSHSAVTSVGEAITLSRNLDARCTCGARPLRACPFWSAVDSALQRRHGLTLDDLDLDAQDIDVLLAHNRMFYGAVSEASGKRFIVDSSKRRLRLAAMLESGQFDVRPIHMLRSPYGVSYSNIRKGRSWFSHAREYQHNVRGTRHTLRRHDHVVVRYERLAADPRAELEPLMAWLGLSFEPGQLNWAQAEHHNVGGNRMRFGTDSTIRLDEKWRAALTPWQKLGVFLATSPVCLPCWFQPLAWAKTIRPAPSTSARPASTARGRNER
jgi:hypothetical protein